MQLTWYGHSNFKIEHGGKVFCIDPFFEGNPSAPVSHESLGNVDAVLVTHDHHDHIGQAVDICAASGATLLGVYDTVGTLVDQGLPQAQAMGFNIGGTVEVAGARVKMVQAEHSSATGVPAGYIITLPGGPCVYHAGDTGLFASMELFSVFHDIDLALLPIGGWFTMDPEQAAYACALLRCAKVAPMHWGTFPILEQSTDEFRAQLAKYAPETALVDIAPGETVTIEK